ncbi:hypothetical protein [Herpetosiphon gulosus]|uniref:Uncharacterized protein n=1 Tax=Herpetosiphon gulosus TaxID=1973496 RepID=A0ABP9X252_9CHLR
MNLLERSGAILLIGLIGLFAVAMLVDPGNANSATSTTLVQASGGPTATPPPEPVLQSPADSAILAQPIAPNKWTFNWQGPRCGHKIYLNGPGDRAYIFNGSMGSGPPPSSFTYSYAQTQALPATALDEWNWHVEYDCGSYQGQSATRRFSVTPANFIYLPFTIR